MRVTRVAILVAVLLALLTGLAPPASADAAGPTDYRTDIVSIEPAAPSIEVEMIGGDSFLSLTQLEPVEIVILGYQAEPYLRFDADGTVFENRRSPAVYLNEERFGEQEAPAFANPEARPEWFVIAENGRYSWHDHRSHWMNPVPPPSAEPGDQVLEATVPIFIDGEPVIITVASFLLDPPSLVPAFAGLAVGIAAIAGLLTRTNRLTNGIVAALAGSGALALGLLAFRSVPSETEPSPLLWFLPALGLGAAMTLLMIHRRVATTVYPDGLAVAAGALMLAWTVTRWSALGRALIPSDAPAFLDRFAIATVGTVGVALLLAGLIGLAKPERLLPVPALPV